jgi:AraC family transcriptional activator FtrA
MPHRVAVLAFDGLAPFELGCVVEVFGIARPDLDAAWWYDVTVCSADPSPLLSVGGLRFVVDAGLEAVQAADTVIVPGWPRIGSAVPADVVDALRSAHRRGARLVGICSGAFVLAATGLLDGRRAATHWKYADALRALHRRVIVDEAVLYVDDDALLTSAGSAAGLDLCLHLVRRDHGSAVANVVARRLVLAPHREGGQAQFIERPVATPDDDRVRQAMEWALRHLDRRIAVADLAARAFMSPRTFGRRFTEAVGQTPMEWLIQQRLRAALPLLEDSDMPMEHIATHTGFSNAATLRKHFRRALGVSPTHYRRGFASGPGRVPSEGRSPSSSTTGASTRSMRW